MPGNLGGGEQEQDWTQKTRQEIQALGRVSLWKFKKWMQKWSPKVDLSDLSD